MATRMEHANISVQDIDAMIRFIQTALPDFVVRGGGDGDNKRWVHIGNASSYLALTQANRSLVEDWVPYSGQPGVNHLGFEVDDAEALRQRLDAAGYRDSTYKSNHPHRRRVYFYDPEGRDWEFIQYFSDKDDERNDYALPG